MSGDELSDFIEHRMRMSHIYQPVMLMTLLAGGGRATVEEIAKAILLHDESQLEYYGKITNEMVGRVLRKHEIVTREGDAYQLTGFADFSGDVIEKLMGICQRKLDEYKARRGR